MTENCAREVSGCRARLKTSFTIWLLPVVLTCDGVFTSLLRLRIVILATTVFA